MKRNHLVILLCLTLLVLISCQNSSANARIKEDLDNFVRSMFMLLNLIFLGITSMALAIGYHKRKKDKEGLKVASIIIISVFGLFTFGIYKNYHFDLADHPVPAILFLCGLVVIGVTIGQLLKGSKRNISEEIIPQEKPKTFQKDEEIPPDQEVY